jgi:rare lipoprotein A
MWRGVVGGLMLALSVAGCGFLFGRSRAPIDARPGATQEGTASWYGPGFHGNRTSSGEIYDQYDLTAAHPTLPLGTRVSVTNLQNGREVEVRVNDRGPFVKSRAIDLSYAAARSLGLLGPGTAPVRIEVLGNESVRLAPVTYTIQVGSFTSRDNAMRLLSTLAQRFDDVYVATLEGASGRYYRVRLGRFERRDEAERLARRVTPLGVSAIILEDGSKP